MRAAPEKFLFDNDFGASRDNKTSALVAEHAQQLKDAEAAAYSRGFAEAQAAALTAAEQKSAAMLDRIAASFKALDQGLAAVEARIET